MRIIFASPNNGAQIHDGRVRIDNWIKYYLDMDSNLKELILPTKLKLDFAMGEAEIEIEGFNPQFGFNLGIWWNWRFSFVKWRRFVCIKRRSFINFRRIPRKNSGMPRPRYFSRKSHGSGRKGNLHTPTKFMILYATVKGCGKNRKMAKVNDF